MVCLYCGNSTKVTNSRPQKRSNRVWRRRECLECQATITTLEKVDFETALSLERAGKLYPFSRDTLFLSIYESLRHRPSAITDASQLTDTIITYLFPKVTHGSISRAEVVDMAKSVLTRFDTAAASHYAAFHKKNRS